MSDAAVVSTNWSFPTMVRFGAGRIRELPRVSAGLGMHRPLLVADPGIVEHEMVRVAKSDCASAGLRVRVFAGVVPNPDIDCLDKGIAEFRAGECDGVIALGGGSALDAGKGIALMLGQTRPVRDFDDKGSNWKRANGDAIPPIVAVPTTAGTGSEVGRAAVITDKEIRRKIIAFHPKLLPGCAILDPELTVGLPPNLTAWTGLDALAHCLEAFCAPGFHPMADGIALEGVRLVRNCLSRSVADGSDLEARAGMLAAAAMGATAFQKGLGAIHSLSHPSGVLYGAHHGRLNGVYMPYVMEFNRPAIEGRVAALAQHAGIVPATFDGFLDWILEIRAAWNVPTSAAGIGLREEDIPEIARLAVDDPTAATNPVPLDEGAARRILEASLAGSP